MEKLSEIEKRHQEYTEHRVLCKCGHSLIITSKDGKELCTHCYRYVFATKDLEKEYRKKELLNRLKREINE